MNRRGDMHGKASVKRDLTGDDGINAVNYAGDGGKAGFGAVAAADAEIERLSRENADLAADLKLANDEIVSIKDGCDRLRNELEQQKGDRRHWQLVADRHDKERVKWRDKYMRLEGCKSFAPVPHGLRWPEFDDGSPVMLGCETDRSANGEAIDAIMFRADRFALSLGTRGWSFYGYGEKVGRAPLRDADGHVIRPCDILYGKSDGKLWRIDHVSGGYAWTEKDEKSPTCKRLRPEWLVRRRPVTIETLLEDFWRATANVQFPSEGLDGIVDEYAGRLRGLDDA